jgi:predicted type IV restriction endonuclease
MDYQKILDELREYAQQNDLVVTWHDVQKDCDNLVGELSTYHKRRVHTAFETWITRKRIHNQS